MSSLRFARIFSDKAVLQRNKEIRIRGFCEKGQTIKTEFAGNTCECAADDAGRFEAVFPAMEKGGPYTITASSGSGESVSCSDVMIGDVVMISGQSNMEFPMSRVRETYPHEWDAPDDPMVRAFKITERGVFGKSLEDVETGEWKAVAADTIDEYSAVGYFTAKHMRGREDVAVGIIDVTLGGAPIEAFMSEEMLEGFDEALSEAKKFSDEEFLGRTLADNEKNANDWLRALDENDAGLAGHFEDGVKILAEGRDIVFPSFFSDTELDGFIGSLWIAKSFTVPKEFVGRDAMLYFGSIVDFDHCYVNGQFVGTTDYTYPPRRYEIPAGLIKEGENTVVLRIGVEKGFGRVTPGKVYGVVFGDVIRVTDGFNERLEGAKHIEYLGGVWKYLVGCRCEASKDTVFVNWKPTALYNGMLRPLAHYGMKAFAFYQGESNCRRNFEYAKLTDRFIKGLRGLWDDDIPYICVQLPEFDSRMEEITYDKGVAWRGLMAAQEECTDIPGFYLVKSYGTGELNDLHPQRKEPIGEKIAAIVATL